MSDDRTDPTPAALADQAAEAIRALNHATINYRGNGYVYPANVNDVLANLATLGQRLPQALDQAQAWLERQDKAGLLGHDTLGTATSTIDQIAAHLEEAGAHAERLATSLDAAAQGASHLTDLTPDDDDFYTEESVRDRLGDNPDPMDVATESRRYHGIPED